MTSEFVYQIGKEAIWTAVLMSMPILMAGMVIGILISIFQAVTQIQDQSISFVPKIVVSIIVLVLAGPWILSVILSLTVRILGDLRNFIR